MDIGTAKPGVAAARARAASPDRHPRSGQSYSAGEFVRDARAAIAAIHAARAICRCWSAARCCICARCITDWRRCRRPRRQLRRELDAQAARAGWPALHAELARVDPAAAARIAPPRRAAHPARAGSVSAHRRADLAMAARTHGARAGISLAALCAAARARAASCARSWPRASTRCCEAGLVDEVRALHARGDLTAQHASMRAVGYRQLWRYCAGECSSRRRRSSAVIATRAAGQASAHLVAARAGRDSRCCRRTL